MADDHFYDRKRRTGTFLLVLQSAADAPRWLWHYPGSARELVTDRDALTILRTIYQRGIVPTAGRET